jgi:hypothetical protein
MANRQWRIGLIALLALVLLASCGPQITRQKQTVDGLTIVLEYPERLTLLKEEELVVILVDDQERTINGALVSLELDMPEMPMGQNNPLADPLGGGKYRVRTTYTMVGVWKVTVVANVERKDYRATFDLQVAS